MQNKHLLTGIATGAVLGAGAAFLVLHEPTKKIIVKHAKKVHKEAIKSIKKKLDKVKTD